MPAGTLWPRQDILALVLPQIATCGRQLTTALTISVMKLLRKYQTPEGKISFEKWLFTAKDRLKWNDSCIKLFWDMLKLVIWYSNNYNNYNSEEEYSRVDLVDVEYLIIYLVLHIPDNTLIQRPSSPTISAHYDTVWPSTNNLFMDAVESNTGLTSPVKEKSNSFASIAPTSPNSTNNNLSIKIPGNSSPTSPTQSRSTSPTSPKRNQSLHSYSQRLSKLSSTQYLYLLKVKINIILTILQDESVVNSSLSSPNDNYIDNINNSNSNNPSISLISRKTIDNLGLILGGGENRDDIYNREAFFLSSLHPKYQTTSKAYESSEMTDGISPPLLYSEVFSWIDGVLSLNEFVYPVHNNHSNSSSPKNGDLFHTDHSHSSGSINSIESSENYMSNRIFIPYKSLSLCKPTVISNAQSSTIMHIVEDFPYNSGSNFNRTSRSIMSISSTIEGTATNSTNKMNTTTTTNTATSVMSISSGSTYDALDQFDEMRSSLEKADIDQKYAEGVNQGIMKLPSLNICNCSNTTLYMMSPYFSAVISGCSDVEIVIGSVAGALTVIGCERVKITVACRKLLVNNCLECTFNIATLSPSIVLGDSRSLLFGPYNLSYKNSQNYILASNLTQLCHSNPDIISISSTNQGIANYWANLCDLNLCLEAAVTAGSPTGYAIDAAADLSLPMPNSATVTILPTTKFSCVTVPYKESSSLSNTAASIMSLATPSTSSNASTNVVNELDDVCIPLPEGYKREYFDNLNTISLASSKLANLNANGGSVAPTLVEVLSDNDMKEQMPINDFISKKFLEWIVSSGHSQEVVNLVQLDASSLPKAPQASKKHT